MEFPQVPSHKVTSVYYVYCTKRTLYDYQNNPHNHKTGSHVSTTVYNPEEVGHVSSIVTRCLVIMAKNKAKLNFEVQSLHQFAPSNSGRISGQKKLLRAAKHS